TVKRTHVVIALQRGADGFIIVSAPYWKSAIAQRLRAVRHGASAKLMSTDCSGLLSRLRSSWLAGLTLPAVGLVAAVASLNAIRRNVNSVTQVPFVDWLIHVLQAFAGSLLIGALILLS